MKPMLLVAGLMLAIVVGCGPAEKKPEEKKPRLKGTGYGDGPISTPIKAKFSMERQLKVQIPVKQYLPYYKIEHEGKGPENQEEFDQMIEKHLPDLPKPQEGFYYHWNVEKEEVEFLPVKK